jgi:hypothetical protein
LISATAGLFLHRSTFAPLRTGFRSVAKFHGIDLFLRIVQQTEDTADRISKKQYMTAAGLGAVVALLCLVVGGAVGYIISNQVRANRLDICTSASFTTSDKRLGCYID